MKTQTTAAGLQNQRPQEVPVNPVAPACIRALFGRSAMA